MPCEGPSAEETLGPELQRATRAACDVFKVLRTHFPRQWKEVKQCLHPRTLDWLKEHDELDARREKDERDEERRQTLRKKALAKLTKEEREAL